MRSMVFICPCMMSQPPTPMTAAGSIHRKELHGGEKPAHGLVELALGGLEAVIGIVEFPQFGGLVGEGLGGLDAGEARLNVRVDGRGALLDGGGRLATWSPAVMPGDGEEHRQDQRDDQRQPPLNGEHDPIRAPTMVTAEMKDILRPVVRQLRDIEEIGGEAAHQLAGAVLIEIAGSSAPACA
jgi:hypothetical protein